MESNQVTFSAYLARPYGYGYVLEKRMRPEVCVRKGKVPDLNDTIGTGDIYMMYYGHHFIAEMGSE